MGRRSAAPFYLEVNQTNQIYRPSWLLPLRLLTYIIVSGIVIFTLNYPRFIHSSFIVYSLATLALPILYLIGRWVRLNTLQKFFPFLQTLTEIAVVVGIVYTTGSINSAFSGLFILTIIAAALVSNLAGTLGIASLISIGYALTIWMSLGIEGSPGSSARALEAIFSSQDAAFYSIFLHILTYFLVAFISGYLVERLKTRDRQLADTSMALRQAKLETDDILRHLNSGLLTIDRSGKIVYFNRAGEEILGYREGDIKGREYRAVFSSRMPHFARMLDDTLNARRPSERGEVDIIDEDGQTVPIGLSTSLLLDEENHIRGIIAIFQDLSETKKLEEKIRTADKMAAVGELSAAIAHEIRNPMAAISGSVEVLRSELEVVGENRRLMDLIVRESSRLNDILSDFLLYARSNRSQYSRVELCRLVSDVFELTRHHPSYKENIELMFASSESYVHVYSDQDQLKQILLNLFVNACQAFGGNGGEIKVDIDYLSDGKISLVVADDGPGIPAEALPKVFNPFFSTKQDGTGLGLAIVTRLAGTLNIDLSMKTEIGRGTSFILIFKAINALKERSKAEKPLENLQPSPFSPAI